MLKIEAIEIVGLDTMPKRRRKMATGAYVYSDKGGWAGRSVLCGIRAGGLVGWGEVRPINPFTGETAAAMFSNLRDFFAPILIGRNAFDIESILVDLDRRLPANPATKSTIDMALHDLVGRALKVPAHVLLGGACRTDIPLEWSISLDDEKTMVAEALDVVSRYGVKTVCIKVGPLDRGDLDIRIARGIQKELGESISLGADANTTFDVNSAVRFANSVNETGRLAYFEQPVPAEQLDDMRRIRDRVTVPIMADESVYSPQDAHRIVQAGAADVLALKFYKCGGLRRAREIAVIANAAGLRANCAGTANGSYIEAIAASHLCASIPNHAFAAEFIMGMPSVNQDDIVADRPIDLDKSKGTCNVSTSPGLGFELDMDAVRHNALAHMIIDDRGTRSV